MDVCFHQDEDARQNSLDDPRFTFVHSNFRFLKNFMRYYGVERVDGILADLGVSFHHFDDSTGDFPFVSKASRYANESTFGTDGGSIDSYV